MVPSSSLSVSRSTISCGLAETTLHLSLLHDPLDFLRWRLIGKQHIHLTDITKIHHRIAAKLAVVGGQKHLS